MCAGRVIFFFRMFVEKNVRNGFFWEEGFIVFIRCLKGFRSFFNCKDLEVVEGAF